jgi:hypothetical protein
LSQFDDYEGEGEGEESPGEDRGFELDKCSRSKPFLSCFILCS